MAGRESAIVTDIAGTTRDVLRENILIDGMPLHIIDTAGLRDSDDPVEQEGIRRAWQEIDKADRILLIVDSNQSDNASIPEAFQAHANNGKLSLILNKCDLSGQTPREEEGEPPRLYLSAKQGDGIELLREHLKNCVGFEDGDSPYIARRRHIEALETAQQHLQEGEQQLREFQAGELLAEELRLVQQSLSEITGAFTSDDLLGRIFSSFCIGK